MLEWLFVVVFEEFWLWEAIIICVAIFVVYRIALGINRVFWQLIAIW